MREIFDHKQLEHAFESQKNNFQSRPPVLRLLSFDKGELLNHPLKPMDHFLIIIEGSIIIYSISPDGIVRYIARSGYGTLLGDMEFSGYETQNQMLYTEASDRVLCLSIPYKENLSFLENDPVFLRFVLRQLAGKLSMASTMDAIVPALEDKVLLYLRKMQPSHEITSVNETMQMLHCSRRQLQRVLKKLCDEELIVKTSRGHYRLNE